MLLFLIWQDHYSLQSQNCSRHHCRNINHHQLAACNRWSCCLIILMALDVLVRKKKLGHLILFLLLLTGLSCAVLNYSTIKKAWAQVGPVTRVGGNGFFSIFPSFPVPLSSKTFLPSEPIVVSGSVIAPVSGSTGTNNSTITVSVMQGLTSSGYEGPNQGENIVGSQSFPLTSANTWITSASTPAGSMVDSSFYNAHGNYSVVIDTYNTPWIPGPAKIYTRLSYPTTQYPFMDDSNYWSQVINVAVPPPTITSSGGSLGCAGSTGSDCVYFFRFEWTPSPQADYSIFMNPEAGDSNSVDAQAYSQMIKSYAVHIDDQTTGAWNPLLPDCSAMSSGDKCFNVYPYSAGDPPSCPSDIKAKMNTGDACLALDGYAVPPFACSTTDSRGTSMPLEFMLNIKSWAILIQ